MPKTYKELEKKALEDGYLGFCRKQDFMKFQEAESGLTEGEIGALSHVPDEYYFIGNEDCWNDNGEFIEDLEFTSKEVIWREDPEVHLIPSRLHPDTVKKYYFGWFTKTEMVDNITIYEVGLFMSGAGSFLFVPKEFIDKYYIK